MFVIDSELHAHYTAIYDEAQRLGSTMRGRLEMIRVREILSKYRPPAPARVADIGGGPGVHAAWLQGEGHRVELLDPIQRHIDAAEKAGVSATLGDARNLPWSGESFDVALLAGPLYHLIDASDRCLALSEAVRVVRPGGVVAVVAMNRHANLIGATIANEVIQRRPIVEEIEAFGHSRHNDRMCPRTYYHTVTELQDELTDAGLVEIQVHGVTGPGGWLSVAVECHFDDIAPSACPRSLTETDPLQTALLGAQLADQYPELLPSNALLMAVGRRASPAITVSGTTEATHCP